MCISWSWKTSAKRERWWNYLHTLSIRVNNGAARGMCHWVAFGHASPCARFQIKFPAIYSHLVAPAPLFMAPNELIMRHSAAVIMLFRCRQMRCALFLCIVLFGQPAFCVTIRRHNSHLYSHSLQFRQFGVNYVKNQSLCQLKLSFVTTQIASSNANSEKPQADQMLAQLFDTKWKICTFKNIISSASPSSIPLERAFRICARLCNRESLH